MSVTEPGKTLHMDPLAKMLNGITSDELREIILRMNAKELEHARTVFEAIITKWDAEVVTMNGVAINAKGLPPRDMAEVGLETVALHLPGVTAREEEAEERRSREAALEQMRKEGLNIGKARDVVRLASKAARERSDAYAEANALLEASPIGRIVRAQQELGAAAHQFSRLIPHDAAERARFFEELGDDATDARRGLHIMAIDHPQALPTPIEPGEHSRLIRDILFNLPYLFRGSQNVV